MCYRFTNIANTYRSNNVLNLVRNSVKFALYTIIFAVFIFVINCGDQTCKIVYAEQNIDNIEQDIENMKKQKLSSNEKNVLKYQFDVLKQLLEENNEWFFSNKRNN